MQLHSSRIHRPQTTTLQFVSLEVENLHHFPWDGVLQCAIVPDICSTSTCLHVNRARYCASNSFPAVLGSLYSTILSFPEVSVLFRNCLRRTQDVDSSAMCLLLYLKEYDRLVQVTMYRPNLRDIHFLTE